MMEQVDRGQEEYIWAMRYRNYLLDDDNEEWKERVLSSDSLTISESSDLSKIIKEQTTRDNQTKVMATIVPDEIISNCNDFNIRFFDACIMYGKISGVTTLVETFLNAKSSVASRLTQILGGYLGSILQEIMNFEGDVINFTGESFIVIWKNASHVFSMQDCSHKALDCALMIQKIHCTEELEQLGCLHTTSSISAGKIYFSLVGNEDAANYVVLGNPLVEVQNAQRYGKRGEIITCMAIWDYLDPSEYLFEEVVFQLFHKVYGVTQSWRNAQKILGGDIHHEVHETSSIAPSFDITTAESKSDICEIRGTVGKAIRTQLGSSLRKFIIVPVLRVIDMNESVEVLTEMRHVVALFVNIVAGEMEFDDYIRVVDKCYTDIYKIVLPADGSIINIKLIDSHIMMLVIFGLRGFKHDLDSQRGLICAMNIYETLKSLNILKVVSVSVTTGTIYCSAVGNIFRREFSVLGPTITKAAKFMMTYPDRVTCDSETFTQSKLETRHFILQEHKLIKGLKGMLAVYEFVNLQNDVYLERAPVNKYPILDRDLEMYWYLKLLDNFVSMEKGTRIIAGIQSCIVIYGQSHQGKTRLLEEILLRTPTTVPIFDVRLLPQDQNIPYQTIFLVFVIPLAINGHSTRQREAKLANYLTEQTTETGLFCVLNEVFKVNFPKTKFYENMTRDQKMTAMKTLLSHLCAACFKNTWALVIDNGEFIDKESWPLLIQMMQTRTAFLVIAIDSNVSSSSYSENNSDVILELVLKPIDRWFHVGLACQILDVKGIPPELEKAIQTKSNGNPGWIESFLISLVQGNKLIIKKVAVDTIERYGLVIPSLEFLTRTHHEPQIDEDIKFLNLGVYKEISSVLKEKWKIYRFSFMDSSTQVFHDMSALFESRKSASRSKSISATKTRSVSLRSSSFCEQINICLLAANAEIDEIEPEVSLNVIVMRIFDYLSSFEQIILKCCSVIGETILRDMLTYILYPRNERTTAVAIGKLFDAAVLKCAERDIVQSQYKIKGQRSRHSSRSDDNKPFCKCRGLVLPDTCKNLPKYAYCNFMKFKTPSFREITYNLLTSNQKKDFHTKAIRYLEKKTRKCQSCGGGLFSRILGIRHDINLVKKTTQVMASRSQSKCSVNVLEDNDLFSLNRANSRVSIASNQSTDHKKSKVDSSKSIMGSSVDLRVSRKTAVRQFQSGSDLLCSFSNFDFSNCQCPEILSNMYRQLIEHTEATDQTEKCMNGMLEFSVICIENFNIPLALKILTKSLTMLNEKHQNFIKPGESWKKEFIRAKTLALLGRCKFESGQLKEALEIYESALRSYGYKLPNKDSFRARFMKCELNLMLYSFMEKKIGSKFGYEAEFSEDISELLSLMCSNFIELRTYEEAEIAAIWSLKHSLKSEKDFAILITSFACLIMTLIRSRKYKDLVGYEMKALLYVSCYRGIIETRDIKAVIHLYSAILESRIIRGDIIKGVDIGMILLKLLQSLNIKYTIHDIHPTVTTLLFLTNRLWDGIQVMFSLEQYSILESDHAGITWFYALCMSLHLDTGFSIIPFPVCENYYFIGAKNLKTNKDLSALKRYLITLWLMHLRLENFEDAEIWEEKILRLKTDDRSEYPVTLFTKLYYLEGLLLRAVYNMNRKNAFLDDVFTDINSCISNLQYHATYYKIIQPKLMVLKAYYQMINQNESVAYDLLNQGRKIAVALGDIYNENLINHTEFSWKGELSVQDESFWMDHAREAYIDYHDIETNETGASYYTYQLPLYN